MKKKESFGLTIYIPSADGSCHQGTVTPLRKPNKVPGALQRAKPGLSVGTIKEAVNWRLRARSLYKKQRHACAAFLDIYFIFNVPIQVLKSPAKTGRSIGSNELK